MVSSNSTKLAAMKAGRDEANRSTGRDLVVVKAAIVEAQGPVLGSRWTSVHHIRPSFRL